MSSSAFTPTTTQVTTEVPVNVPVVTKDKLFTPIIGISGTFSSQKGEYQRAGNRMNGRVQLTFATVSAINSPYTLTLPDSLTYDGSNIPVSDEPIVGTFSLWDASASYIEFMGTVHVNSSNSLKFKTHGQTAFNNSSSPVTIAANDILEIQFSIPIAEWAGSGTTTLADRALEEYYATSGTWDANSSTTVTGPDGAAMGGALTLGRTKTITLLSNLLPTDKLFLEMRFGSSSASPWVDASNSGYQYTRQGAIEFGATITSISGNTVTIYFAPKALSSNTTYANVTGAQDWNSTWSWRLRKVSSGAQVGYPISTKNIVGATDGVAPVTGMLGERVTWSTQPVTQSVTISEADWTNSSITIGAGTWLLSAQVCATIQLTANAGNDSELNVKITDASNNEINRLSRSIRARTPAAAINLTTQVINLSTIVSTSSTTTYKIRVRKQDNVGTATVSVYNEASNYSDFFAVRIA